VNLAGENRPNSFSTFGPRWAYNLVRRRGSRLLESTARETHYIPDTPRQPEHAFSFLDWRQPAMVKITLNETLRAELGRSGDVVELCDQSGATLGYFHPVASPDSPPPQSPYTDQQIESLRQQGTGRPLSEIMDELRQQ
jgi:hypothetical protein